MEYHTNSGLTAGATALEVDPDLGTPHRLAKTWIAADSKTMKDEVCLTRSSFTAFYSTLQQARGRNFRLRRRKRFRPWCC